MGLFEDGTVDRQTLPEYVLRQVGMELDDRKKWWLPAFSPNLMMMDSWMSISWN
jgi:hypothetical protein